ncbi:hypothetical protein FRC17_006273, partial [Serendipita sp. 399]
PGQATLPVPPSSSTPPRKLQNTEPDEDFEEDFSLPDDLAHLSLRPLRHQSSKTNLDGWGDQTNSSTVYSSEASSFGLHTNESPSSTSFSRTGAETDDDEECLLDGLVLPEGLFDGEKSDRQLHRIIEERKKNAAAEPNVTSPLEDDDFEKGLVIDDDVDFNLARVKQHRHSLSASRLSKLQPQLAPLSPPNEGTAEQEQSSMNSPEHLKSSTQRPKSPLSRSFASVARESAHSSDRASPISFRPQISTQVRTARASFHVPARPTFSTPPPSSFNSPTFDSGENRLRRQTSAGALQGNSSSSDEQRSRRETSVSLIDVHTAPSTSGDAVRVTLKRPDPRSLSPVQTRRISPTSPGAVDRYNSPVSTRSISMHAPFSPATLFSISSASRFQQSPHMVPPTPPGTPSSNPIALRLTMSTTSSRAKTRPALTSVFPGASMSGQGISRPTSFAAAVKSPPVTRSPLTPGTPRAESLPSPLRTSLSRSSTMSAASASIPRPPQAKILKRPKRLVQYDDGSALDAIEDLPVNREVEDRYKVVPKGYSTGGRIVRKDSGTGKGSMSQDGRNDSTGSTLAQRRRADLSSNRASVSSSVTATPSLGKLPLSPLSSPKLSQTEKRRSSGAVPPKRRPMLIRNLNGVGGPKVVGEMRWNPKTCRWEGNEQEGRDFENAIKTSTRPALITQLSGSALGSPASGSSSGARVVGNMLFDPVKMCWVSQLPPGEEEPDVFADLADDEEEDLGSWGMNKGGTIRANSLGGVRVAPPTPRLVAPPGKVIIEKQIPSRVESGALVVVGGTSDNPSPSRSTHSRGQSGLESGSEAGSRQTNEQDGDGHGEESAPITDELIEETHLAESRHRSEIKGWL